MPHAPSVIEAMLEAPLWTSILNTERLKTLSIVFGDSMQADNVGKAFEEIGE